MIKNIVPSILLAAFACLPLFAETLPILPEGAIPLRIATNGTEIACAWSADGPVPVMSDGDGYPKGKVFLSSERG